jgi:predicted Zn-dependent protease with MMP-like domain
VRRTAFRPPAPAGRPSRSPELLEVDPEEFERLIGAALDGLPPELAGLIRNVVVLAADEPPEPGLLGLYEGIPLTERGAHYGGVLPDRITIFRGPLCRLSRDVAQLQDEVRVTVLHEIGHHFGIDDDRLHELGW